MLYRIYTVLNDCFIYCIALPHNVHSSFVIIVAVVTLVVLVLVLLIVVVFFLFFSFILYLFIPPSPFRNLSVLSSIMCRERKVKTKRRKNRHTEINAKMNKDRSEEIHE